MYNALNFLHFLEEFTCTTTIVTMYANADDRHLFRS